LDIIGLGGYRRLPFAAANRLGVPSAIELIERIPANERPDLLALYPSWWGAFPLWFGRRITEVPVNGNVICGGSSKVLYASDWRSLERSSRPLRLHPGEAVVDELDIADLISEREHEYTLSRPGVGHVKMKMLAHSDQPSAPLWDAGRSMGSQVSEAFVLRGLDHTRPARLLFRTAPAQPASFAVVVEEQHVADVELSPKDAWQEPAVTVAPQHLRETVRVRIDGVANTRELHHVWAVQLR
jgi:hypothetical protein